MTHIMYYAEAAIIFALHSLCFNNNTVKTDPFFIFKQQQPGTKKITKSVVQHDRYTFLGTHYGRNHVQINCD